jgi:hypothetical protein
MHKILITSGDVSMQAELNDGPTAQDIWDKLPLEGKATTWGDEIYFVIPVSMDQEPDARADVEVGELGYWPTGFAFCIFFGPTPASTDDKPRAYSPVNIVGRVLGDAVQFKVVKDGEPVRVERAT